MLGALQGCSKSPSWRDASVAALCGPKHEKQPSHQTRSESSSRDLLSSPVLLCHLTRTPALQIRGHTKYFTYFISSPELWERLTRWSTWSVGDDKGKQRSRKANGLPSPSCCSVESFYLLDSPLSFPHKQALGQRASLHEEKRFTSIGIAAILWRQSALTQLIAVKPC